MDTVFLITPDGTDTMSWWHEYIAEYADYIWFSYGRIKYMEADGTESDQPTFGTVISIYGETTPEMLGWLDGKGHLVQSVKT